MFMVYRSYFNNSPIQRFSSLLIVGDCYGANIWLSRVENPTRSSWCIGRINLNNDDVDRVG